MNKATNLSQHEAVINAIRAETDAFMARDLEAWSKCWVHDERTHDVYISAAAGLNVISGWPAVRAHMEHVLISGLGCQKVEFRQANHQITVEGNTAWVVFDGWSKDSIGATENSFETRILEFQDGRWRIAYSSVMQTHAPGETEREIAVDKNGHIIWAGNDGLSRLKEHLFLTVSNGQIRGRQREWDNVLQAAVNEAGAYHGYFEMHRFSQETGGPLKYPVILGSRDDGGVAFVLFSVRDGATYICVDEEGMAERRLAIAQAVYGLSDGQKRVATLIAAGQGLPQIADTLGISVNTARTHLSRLYEKTGVNAQTALVRLLLSVG